MAQTLSDNLQCNAPKVLDNRSGRFSSGVWRPYNDLTEFNSAQPLLARPETLIFWVRSTTDATKADLYTLDSNKDPYLVTSTVDLSDYYTKEEVDGLFDDEIDARVAGDANSIEAVNTEATARIAGDLVNSTAISNETNARILADSNKADKDDLVEILEIEYADSGWNVGKTVFTFANEITAAYYIYSNTVGRYLVSGEVTKTSSNFTLPVAAVDGDVFYVLGALGTLNNFYPRTEILVSGEVGVNKFNKNDPNNLTGYTLNPAGVPIVAADRTVSSYIDATLSEDWYITNSDKINFYDVNKDHIGTQILTPTAITLPEDALYFRVSTFNTLLNVNQIVIGTEAPTFYTPYSIRGIRNTSNIEDVNEIIAEYIVNENNDSVTLLSQRIEKYIKKLNGRSTLQIGLVDFTDIGITQPNPLGLKYWFDGTIAWALKKIDENFKSTWREGNIFYLDATTGDRYVSVSVAKMHDPSLMDDCVTYYQSYVTGTDSTTFGLTDGSPFKRLNYAVAQAIANAGVGGDYEGQPANIIVLDEWVGSDSGLITTTIPDNIKIKITGRPPDRSKKTRLVGMRESYTDTLFAWTETSMGSGVWGCSSASINLATRNTPMCFDLLYRDVDDAPTPLKYIAPQANEALTIALIQATPSSFGSYNNAGTTTLYVHLQDGRVPSVDNWVYAEASGQMNNLVGEGAVLFLENLERIFTSEAVQLAGIRARPINVPSSYLTHTGQFWTYNCAVYGASGQGVQIYDMQYGGNEYLTVKYCREDGENLHSFNTFAFNPLMGNYIHYHSNFIIAEFLGENYFKNMPTLGISTQVTSAHDRVNFICLNTIGGYTNGTPFAHVSGAQVTHINCHGYYPTQPTGQQPPLFGSPKSIWWSDGAGVAGDAFTKINLLGCSGHPLRDSSSKGFCVTNNGIITVFQYTGTTSAFPIYNGGTLTFIAP